MSNIIKLNYGQSVFNVKVNYTDRKTLGISVYPNCNIVASSPKTVSREIILTKLKKRGKWIKKQVDYFNQFRPRTPERKFVSGETHLYLGKQYRLKLLEGETESIELKGKYFFASSKNISSVNAKKLMTQWYKAKASVIFIERLEACRTKFLNYEKPKLIIRNLNKCWGSMTENNNLTLNTSLVRAPIDCIDYVIIHELCHMEHPNHSPDFWRLLDKKLPSWKKIKFKLETLLK